MQTNRCSIISEAFGEKMLLSMEQRKQHNNCARLRVQDVLVHTTNDSVIVPRPVGEALHIVPNAR